MTLYRGDLVKGNTPPFVIIDIDDETYQNWKEPLFTPRDKLLKLIQFAITGQQKLIIVDIAIYQQQPGQLHPHDLDLQQYLAQRPTFLDQIVINSKHIHWATTQFEREYARILRCWHLLTPTCTKNIANIVLSVPLLATSLLFEKDIGQLKLPLELKTELAWKFQIIMALNQR